MIDKLVDRKKVILLYTIVLLLFHSFLPVGAQAATMELKWEKAASVSSDELKSVTANENIVVAVGQDGAVLYSQDGSIWRRSVLPNTVNLILLYGQIIYS